MQSILEHTVIWQVIRIQKCKFTLLPGQPGSSVIVQIGSWHILLQFLFWKKKDPPVTSAKSYYVLEMQLVITIKGSIFSNSPLGNLYFCIFIVLPTMFAKKINNFTKLMDYNHNPIQDIHEFNEIIYYINYNTQGLYLPTSFQKFPLILICQKRSLHAQGKNEEQSKERFTKSSKYNQISS